MVEVTIIIPVYNEGENISAVLKKIENEVNVPHVINIIYDFEEDNTIPVVQKDKIKYQTQINLLKNKHGQGALNAMKTGLEELQTEYAVITMADLSDPPDVINEMIKTACTDYSVTP